MIDERFYLAHGPLPVEALFPGQDIRGDRARPIRAGAALHDAGKDDVAYYEGRATGRVETGAGALVLSPKNAERAPEGAVIVVTSHPRAAFAQAAARLASVRPFPQDAIDASARIEAGADIGPGAVIGAEARIGSGVEIGPNAVIGPGVAIGRRTRIGAGAVIGCSLIGDDVRIGPNSVIGEAGFGVAGGPDGVVDVPHLGRVIIQDRVRLGACVTVDRGMFGDTIVSEDAKIDNLCHIAHNVLIGRGVMIAAFGGVSGSSQIGDGAVLGGRAGLKDHVVVGPGAQIAAGAAVLSDVPAGERWAGYPAKPLMRWARELSWLAKAAGKKDVGD